MFGIGQMKGGNDVRGDLEQMALFAGESAAPVDQVSSAAKVIERLLNEAIDASFGSRRCVSVNRLDQR